MKPNLSPVVSFRVYQVQAKDKKRDAPLDLVVIVALRRKDGEDEVRSGVVIVPRLFLLLIEERAAHLREHLHHGTPVSNCPVKRALLERDTHIPDIHALRDVYGPVLGVESKVGCPLPLVVGVDLADIVIAHDAEKGTC